MLVDERSCSIFLDRFTILSDKRILSLWTLFIPTCRGLSVKGLCKITHIFHGASWNGPGNNVGLSGQFPAFNFFRQWIGEDDYWSFLWGSDIATVISSLLSWMSFQSFRRSRNTFAVVIVAVFVVGLTSTSTINGFPLLLRLFFNCCVGSHSCESLRSSLSSRIAVSRLALHPLDLEFSSHREYTSSLSLLPHLLTSVSLCIFASLRVARFSITTSVSWGAPIRGVPQNMCSSLHPVLAKAQSQSSQWAVSTSIHWRRPYNYTRPGHR